MLWTNCNMALLGLIYQSRWFFQLVFYCESTALGESAAGLE